MKNSIMRKVTLNWRLWLTLPIIFVSIAAIWIPNSELMAQAHLSHTDQQYLLRKPMLENVQSVVFLDMDDDNVYDVQVYKIDLTDDGVINLLQVHFITDIDTARHWVTISEFPFAYKYIRPDGTEYAQQIDHNMDGIIDELTGNVKRLLRFLKRLSVINCNSRY